MFPRNEIFAQLINMYTKLLPVLYGSETTKTGTAEIILYFSHIWPRFQSSNTAEKLASLGINSCPIKDNLPLNQMEFHLDQKIERKTVTTIVLY